MKNREFYRHKMEKPIKVISIFISFLVFVILAYIGYVAAIGSEENNFILQILKLDSEFSEFAMKIGGYIAIVIILFVVISIYFACLISESNAQAKDIYVTEKQFPSLIKAEKAYAKKLGIKKLPKLFVAKNREFLVVQGASFDNPNVIRIPSSEIIATANHDYYAAKFFIAKHLAAMYMGYFSKILFLMTAFSNWIPILNNVVNRLITYSTDKIAAELVGKEKAIKSIMESEVDIYILPYLNDADYIENTKKVVKNKDMMWENLFSDIPIPSYRIDAIRSGKDGKLF